MINKPRLSHGVDSAICLFMYIRDILYVWVENSSDKRELNVEKSLFATMHIFMRCQEMAYYYLIV